MPRCTVSLVMDQVDPYYILISYIWSNTLSGALHHGSNQMVVPVGSGLYAALRWNMLAFFGR